MLSQVGRYLAKKSIQAVKTWALTNVMSPLQLPYIASSLIVMILV